MPARAPVPPAAAPGPRKDGRTRARLGWGAALLAAGGLAAWFLASAHGGSGSPGAAPGTSAPAAAGAPSPACTLKTTFDYIVRTAEPGIQPQAQEIGNVDLASCTDSLAGFAATAGQAPGECTEIAKASDNPGYNVDAADPAPLKYVIEKAGPGC